MEKIFGIPTTAIAVALGIVLGLILAVVIVLGIVQPVLVRMGVRNIPRRRAQTILIIVGLMLASLIITASLGIGDTLAYSFKNTALAGYGNLDVSIARHRRTGTNPATETPYLSQADVDSLTAKAKAIPQVKSVIPLIQEDSSITDQTSKQVHSDSAIFAVPPSFDDAYGVTAHGSAGQVIRIGDLKPGEVLATKAMTKQLNAKPGDKLIIYVGKKPIEVTVRDTTDLDFVGQSIAVMGLQDYQNLAGKQGQVNDIEIVTVGATDLDHLANSDPVVTALRDDLTDTKVALDLKNLLAQPNVQTLFDDAIRKQQDGSIVKDKLQTLRAEVAKPDVTADFKKLVQDRVLAPTLLSLVPKLPQADQVRLFTDLDTLTPFDVVGQKTDAVDTADLIASALTGLFLVCGLFSIAVGLLLIFLIFIMLAAERKPEMGMARALGIKRGNLTLMYLFEGTVYSAGAAFVGVVLGIGVGYVMVKAVASIFSTFSDSFVITDHIEPRSLIIAFSLGMLVTFIVVVISAARVSRLNIVAAIRDLPDEEGSEDKLVFILAAPFVGFVQGFRLLGRGQLFGFVTHSLWVLVAALGVLNIVGGAAVSGIIFIGLSLWTIIWALTKRGPVPVILGLLIAAGGVSGLDRGTYELGVSLLIIGVGLTLRWILRALIRPERANRIGFSVAGLGLLLYWAKPFGVWEKLFGLGDALNYDKMDASFTLFFISGVMLVAGAVWTIMYNNDFLIALLTRITNLSGRFAPIARTALAYPLQARFRTGMLIAMFALITFTIIFMSVVIDINNAAVSDINKIGGSWTITANANSTNSSTDIPAKVAADPTLSGMIAATSALTHRDSTQAHQQGKTDVAFANQSVTIADGPFFDNNTFTFSARAKGYENLNDHDLWQAVKNRPNLAVIDNGAVSNSNGGGGGGFGPAPFAISGIDPKAKTFAPVTVELRDAKNAIRTVTIIGLIDNPWYSFSGMYMSQATAAVVFPGEPLAPSVFLFKVKSGVDPEQARLALGSAFLADGLEPVVLKTTIDKQLGAQNGFYQLLQGFLALGLLVGIAGLGVISTRAVVERRQQIGMLRAIGYKRGTVQFSFLLESSFVAILGLVLGAGLGILDAYLFINDSGSASSSTLQFSIPWGQIALILIGSYLATLITTYLPARAAARIYPAEALRYE